MSVAKHDSKYFFIKRIFSEQIKKMKDYVFLSVAQAHSDKKKNSSGPNRSRTYDLPISTSDALPLSYRRLVVAGPLK